mmetsp:Transcript_10466/g.30714  ORF Transcript_10466/g.30714 Transcript_10466/m.30714 type:complete len:115 (+) Transcript_10466:301-645(+)
MLSMEARRRPPHLRPGWLAGLAVPLPWTSFPGPRWRADCVMPSAVLSVQGDGQEGVDALLFPGSSHPLPPLPATAVSPCVEPPQSLGENAAAAGVRDEVGDVQLLQRLWERRPL